MTGISSVGPILRMSLLSPEQVAQQTAQNIDRDLVDQLVQEVAVEATQQSQAQQQAESQPAASAQVRQHHPRSQDSNRAATNPTNATSSIPAAAGASNAPVGTEGNHATTVYEDSPTTRTTQPSGVPYKPAHPVDVVV